MNVVPMLNVIKWITLLWFNLKRQLVCYLDTGVEINFFFN